MLHDTFPNGRDAFPAGHDILPTGQNAFPTGRDAFPNGRVWGGDHESTLTPGSILRARRRSSLLHDTFPNGRDAFPAGHDVLPTGQNAFPSGRDAFPNGRVGGVDHESTLTPGSILRARRSSSLLSTCIVHRASSSLLGPVLPSFRALSWRLRFTVRRHKFKPPGADVDTRQHSACPPEVLLAFNLE